MSPHFGFVNGLLPLEPAASVPLDVPEANRLVDLSDSDDSGTEVQIVSSASRPEEISQIDETRRGTFNALKYGRERPDWPSSWLSLVMSIRLLGAMCVSGDLLRSRELDDCLR